MFFFYFFFFLDDFAIGAHAVGAGTVVPAAVQLLLGQVAAGRALSHFGSLLPWQPLQPEYSQEGDELSGNILINRTIFCHNFDF